MKEYHSTQEGVRELIRTLLVGSVDSAVFDAEGEDLNAFLSKAAYLTLEDLQDLGMDGSADRRYRAHFRYLAALLPGRTLHELADSIHYVIGCERLSITQVRDILRGRGQDVPIEKIQEIGEYLSSGVSLRETARKVGVSFDTVQRIERFLGIAEARRLRLVDAACDAIREGWSVRQFATNAEIPKSSAHVLMQKARSVLVEIGELSE